MSYSEFFKRATEKIPYDYQSRVVEQPWRDLLDILTGLGKTAAVALAWIYKRSEIHDHETPRKAQVEEEKSEPDNAKHELETSDTTVAGIAAGGKGPAPLGADSPERGREHGLRGGAGGPEIPASGTRPSHATRYIKTTLGILSYGELAPHLGHKARLLEEDIESGKFDGHDLDDSLIRELHIVICGDLVPRMISFRRVDVTVGARTPLAWHHGSRRIEHWQA